MRCARSDWTCAEYRGAIAAKHRSALVDAADLSALASGLDLLRLAKFNAVPTLATDVLSAGELAVQVAHTPLRAVDALPTAIAAGLGVTHFASFDPALAAVAAKVLVGV